MSRVGRLPIEIPSGVEVKLDNGTVKVKGSLGELSQEIHPAVDVSVADGKVTVARRDDQKESRSIHGLMRTLIQNMVTGVSEGFKKSLEVVGVGYRANLKGKILEMSLGHSHPIEFDIPEGIKIEVGERNTLITISGRDKSLIGHVAAKLRSFRPPEPYKGKGVKYVGETIRRKAGKSAAGSA